MKRFLYPAALAGLLVLLASGCALLLGDGFDPAADSGGALTDQEAVELTAAEIASASGGSVLHAFLMMSGTALTSVDGPGHVQITPQQTSEPSSSFLEGNRDLSAAGEYDYVMVYEDSTGTEVDDVDATQIDATGTMGGTSERTNGTATFSSDVALLLTDINDGDDTATLDGEVEYDTSNGTFVRASGSELSFTGDNTHTWQQVDVEAPTSRPDDYPEGGRIVVKASYRDGDGDTLWSGTVTFIFDGNETARATVGGVGYEVNLETARIE